MLPVAAVKIVKQFDRYLFKCIDRAGGAYGYVDMGGWIGGQAEYVMVPYADFNLLKFLTKSSHGKILDLTMLTDILPTGFTGSYGRCEGWFSRIYRRCRASRSSVCLKLSILGAAIVIVGDLNEERLAHAKFWL
jgi:glutathione-independent formaldehyde dehydrogenase